MMYPIKMDVTCSDAEQQASCECEACRGASGALGARVALSIGARDPIGLCSSCAIALALDLIRA